MGSIHLTEWGEKARATLGQVIARLKADDPLAPVTVVTPNFYSGLALRRVAAGLELRNGDSRGIANVSFTTLPRLAADLGAPALIERGLRQITPERAAEAVRAALSRAIPSKDPLSALVSNPSTEQAFSRVIGELEHAPEEILEALVDSGKALASLSVRVLREYKKLTERYYGSADVAMAAANQVRKRPEKLNAVGDIVLYCPIRLKAHEWQLISAFVPRLDAILALTGEEAPDAATTALGDALTDLGLSYAETPQAPKLASTPVRHATQIITAPDAEEEVRAVMRKIVRAAEGGEHLYRKAVVYTVDDPYAQLIVDLFTEAAIPFSGAVAETLFQSVPGRILVGGLRFALHDCDRAKLISWIASGPVFDVNSTRSIPARQWDHISRKAKVIRGSAEWAERLDALIASRNFELESEMSESKRIAQTIEIENASAMKNFILNFAATYSIFVGGNLATWSEFAAKAIDLLDRYTGGTEARSHWEGGEKGAQVRAYDKIKESLESLATLADLREQISSDTFVQAVHGCLSAPAPHERKFGDGVFVGRIADAVAADFESIYVLGGYEGNMPARRRDNPLISEAERTFATAKAPPWPLLLPTQSDQEAQARTEFLAAMFSASRDRVLCHPVGDIRTGKPVIPARWVVEEAQALAYEHDSGRRVTAEDLTGLAPIGPWHARVVSLAAELISSDFTPAAADEYELHRLMAAAGTGPQVLNTPEIGSDPDLRRSISSQLALRDKTASEYCGLVGANPQFAPSLDYPVSTTALETWAKCPYKYMLEKILRLTVIEKPEAIEDIAPSDRGLMIHSILDKFHSEHRNQPAGKPWTEKDRERLRELANSEFKLWEERGLTGRAALWEMTKSRTLRLLDQFLNADSRLRAKFETCTVKSEQLFGFSQDESLPALRLSPDGVMIAIRGKIDRVDESPDGNIALIIDYKTGKVKEEVAKLHRIKLSTGEELPDLDLLSVAQGGKRAGYRGGTPLGDPVGGGKLLQLPLYALGSGTNAKNILVLYWHFDSTTYSSTCYGYVMSPEARSRLDEVLGTIISGITSGTFPMNPGITETSKKNSNCNYCNFDAICPGDRAGIANRKSVAPEYAKYWTLVGMLDE